MHNPERPQVNQRLYYVTLHLQSMQRLLDEQQVPRRVVEQAMGESVLLHLVMVYRCYLRELAVAYGIDGSRPETAMQLQQALNAADKHSAECEELMALEADGGWLCSMLDHYLALGAESQADAARSSPDAGIRFHSVDDNLLDIATLQSLYDQLHAVIENQRTRLEEW